MEIAERTNEVTRWMEYVTVLAVAAAFGLGRYCEIESYINPLILNGYLTLPSASLKQEVLNAIMPICADSPGICWFHFLEFESLTLQFIPAPSIQAGAIFCSVLMMALGGRFLFKNRNKKAPSGMLPAAVMLAWGSIIFFGNFCPQHWGGVKIDFVHGVIQDTDPGRDAVIDFALAQNVVTEYDPGMAFSNYVARSGYHGMIQDADGHSIVLFEVGTSQQAVAVASAIQTFVHSRGNMI